ncbi:hypothetical protein D3C80_1678700 [compost metagenome]
MYAQYISVSVSHFKTQTGIVRTSRLICRCDKFRRQRIFIALTLKCTGKPLVKQRYVELCFRDQKFFFCFLDQLHAFLLHRSRYFTQIWFQVDKVSAFVKSCISFSFKENTQIFRKWWRQYMIGSLGQQLISLLQQVIISSILQEIGPQV